MAAMKPRTGDGPLEVTKEGRGIIMRVPLEGGGRLVVEMTPDEAKALGADLTLPATSAASAARRRSSGYANGLASRIVAKSLDVAPAQR